MAQNWTDNNYVCDNGTCISTFMVVKETDMQLPYL